MVFRGTYLSYPLLCLSQLPVYPSSAVRCMGWTKGLDAACRALSGTGYAAGGKFT